MADRPSNARLAKAGLVIAGVLLFGFALVVLARSTSCAPGAICFRSLDRTMAGGLALVAVVLFAVASRVRAAPPKR